MSKYTEITYEIKEINNNEFNEKTLRNIQVLTKRLNHYYTNNQITKLEFLKLYKKYKEMIKNKLKEIYPENYKTLSKKLNKIFYQEYDKIPTDITIIDNDLTLLLNKSFDNPYKQDEIKFLHSKYYKELPDEHSKKTYENCYYEICLFEKENSIDFYNFYFPTFDNTEQKKASLEILINYINLLLKPYNNYKNKTIEYNYNTNKIVYPKNSNMKVFINIPLKDIILAIYRKETISFNLVAINEWNEIHSYKITQIPTANKYYNWQMERIDLPIWNLSTSLQKNKTLTRKKVDK